MATSYIIFGTNIFPVPVPVCCMFFVSQSIHIKRSPNAMKFYGELFWNICDFWEVESSQTGAHSHHKTPRPARQPKRVWVVPFSNVGRSSTSGARKLISRKKRVKISAQSELWISGNIRNGFHPDLGNAEQKRIEGQIQSWWGSRPSAAREATDQRGTSPPI